MGIASVFLTILLVGPASCQAYCFGATFDTIGNGFEYRAHLQLPESCAETQTRVTRLFIAGACGKEHQNNFDGYPPACPAGDVNVLNTSEATCEEVFNIAYERDVRVTQGNGEFDNGKICNNGITGVIFVETSCSAMNASSVVLQQRLLGDELCWDGRTLSRGQLVGIVVASVVGFCILLGAGLYFMIHFKHRWKYAWMAQKARSEERRKHGYPSAFYDEHRRCSPIPEYPQQLGEERDPEIDDSYNTIFDDELQTDEGKCDSHVWTRPPKPPV